MFLLGSELGLGLLLDNGEVRVWVKVKVCV